jgi:hypothetical protein
MVHLLVIGAGGPVPDGRLHPGGQSGRVEEPKGLGGSLDLLGFAQQLGKCRPIIARRGQPLGDAEEERKICAHPGQVLLHRSGLRRGRCWVPTHGYQDGEVESKSAMVAPHRPTQRRMSSSAVHRLVPVTR